MSNTPVTVTHLTIPELAIAHAAAEVARVKRAVAASLDAHPLRGTDPAVWEYMADLMAAAFRIGAHHGHIETVEDMNTRYTMRPRSLPLTEVLAERGDGVPGTIDNG